MANEQNLGKYEIVADTGKVIFREGDSGSHMYIIRSGRIKISKKIDQKEVVLTILQKGDFFGEMALVSNSLRAATATAVTTANLLALNRLNFISMVQKNGNIALNIIEKLCHRLQNTNQQLKLIASKDYAALFAQSLYYSLHSENAQNDSINYLDFFRELSLTFEIPQAVANQLLELYKKQQIIEISNAKIILLDDDKLSTLAKVTQRL